MKVKFLIFILLFISYSSFSQGKMILEGEVISEKTKEYVPYAHIQVLETGLGAVSDGKGKFRFVIPGNLPGAALSVSCIGFKTKIVKVSSGSEKIYRLTITLEEDVAALGAVTVFSGDLAKGLVKEAIDRIGRNYPAGEERLEGFYREQLSADSLFSNPYYVAEAILEVKKGSYKKKVKNGDVKVLKGRKYQGPSYDSLQMRFYAGTHIPHRHDFVMRREGPLDERNLNKYDFKILDTLNYESEDLILVSFRPVRGAGGSGELYISQDSYAFVKGVFPDEEERQIEMLSQFKEIASGYKRSYRKYVTEYAKQDTLWRLRSSAYETAFKNEEEALYLNSVFTTTDFDTTKAEIPYAERIHYGDIFLEKTGE